MPEFPGGVKPPMSKKRLLVIGGAGVVVAVAGIWWWRKSHGTASGTATDTSGQTTDQSGIDPQTGLPYSQDMSGIDPNTGVPYADEFGNFGGSGGGFGGINWPIDQGGGTQTQTQTVTTNAEWLQAASAYLTAHNYNATTVDVALGKYLLGQPLTHDQMLIVQAAVGFEGQPPQGAPAPHSTVPTGQKKRKVIRIRANGHTHLNGYAAQYDMNQVQILGLNPQLAAYWTSPKAVPAGTTIRVYAKVSGQ